RLVANSESVATFYQELGFPRDKITVIPNGVEAPSLAADRKQRLRQVFGIPPERRVIGFAGRLARQKRIKDLVWGLQLLKQLRDGVHLVLIGDGPERSGILDFA